MKIIKNIYSVLVVAAVVLLSGSAVSCKDDIPADSYYTFTGEMMSDVLQNNSNYTQFAEIVRRSSASKRGINLMDLVSCYGQFTCFAPTNSAIDVYLAENGYASVSEIPADVCDTIARTHLVSGGVYTTIDFEGLTDSPYTNMNNRKFKFKEQPIVDEAGDTVNFTFRLNNSSSIIIEMSNDSVVNGVIHAVDKVIKSSNETIGDLLLQNSRLTLFTAALQVTGLLDKLKSETEDKTWDPNKFEPKKDVQTGAETQKLYLHVPKTKKIGFTVFACPNEALNKMGLYTVQDMYDYACSIYGGENLDVTDPANEEKLMELTSPLRRLLAYNMLRSKGVYGDLTTICTVKTESINPCEWYSTVDPLTTIKVERLTVEEYLDRDVQYDLYLNRGDRSREDYTKGVHVLPDVEEENVNDGENGVYYYTDGLADYGTTTKENIFNTRMRIDLYTMFPELMTNGIRDGKTTNKIADCGNPDPNVSSPNYWFPKGYLDNVKVNDDGIFLFQSQHNTYWSYEGDEFNMTSDVGSYDITFNLPSVPSGTYQIRLGFADMPTRGICQFYLDGVPKGVPFDMRSYNFEDKTGWFNLETTTLTGEELAAAKKGMHQKGWYHGPKGVYCVSGEGHKDEYGPNTSYNRNFFSGIARTVRYVVCTDYLDENVQHTVRVKSVWCVDKAVVMLDYFELVPKSVYGVEGAGRAEDDF